MAEQGSPAEDPLVAETSVDLRVATWNILAPVWVEASLYPCISQGVYAAEARRRVLQRRMHELRVDVLMLNEVQKSELTWLLDQGEMPVSKDYECHFVPFPEEMWSQLHNEPAEWGVALLWRRGCFTSVVTGKLDLPGGAPPVGFVRGTLPAWGQKVLIATAHLDGDGCPPSVSRSQSQLLHAADLTREAGADCAVVIWGGDCNLTPSAPAFSEVRRNFLVASSHSPAPTCLSAVASARLDHLFCSGPVVALQTEIPECPEPQCCCMPSCCMHTTQYEMDMLGLSSPKVPAGRCCWRRLLGAVLALPMSCVAVCCFGLPFPCSVRRCRWALSEWGSDHLPVVTTFRWLGFNGKFREALE